MPERTALIDAQLDRLLLHPALGVRILALVMFCIFQAVFSWATPLSEGIDAAAAWLGASLTTALPERPLTSLLVDGIIAGLGGVLVFLLQILILFAFILALEESGYLPRASFLLDRMMSGAGLSGRSFIPLLSSFACAIPRIMATRSITDPRERLATILVAPLMTCSARLPVYTMATVYALSSVDAEMAAEALGPLIAVDWSLATALSLLVWYMYAPMWLSTLATIKRETNSWKRMGFAAIYLFALAYAMALLTCQTAVALGAG